MIALEKEALLGQRPRRKSPCKSQLRQACASQISLTRRFRFGLQAMPALPPSDERSPRASHEPSQGAIQLYLREIGKVRPLSPKAEHALVRRAQRGVKSAREQLLKASLPLVVSIAVEYEGVGLPLLDLIAEGNVGLLKAMIRFDPAGKDPFRTRAAWWVRQAIKRALAEYARAARLA